MRVVGKYQSRNIYLNLAEIAAYKGKFIDFIKRTLQMEIKIITQRKHHKRSKIQGVI